MMLHISHATCGLKVDTKKKISKLNRNFETRVAGNRMILYPYTPSVSHSSSFEEVDHQATRVRFDL